MLFAQATRRSPQPASLTPLPISKLNTLIQLLLVCVVIVHYGLASLPAWLLNGVIGLTAATTLWSGAAYVWRWGRLARRKTERPAAFSPDRDR